METKKEKQVKPEKERKFSFKRFISNRRIRRKAKFKLPEKKKKNNGGAMMKAMRKARKKARYLDKKRNLEIRYALGRQ